MIDTERLRQLLADRGWSQADLARFVGATPPAIQQLLSGRTKRSKLEPQIARLFRVSEAWLRGETDTPFEPVTGTMSPEELATELRLRLSGSTILGLTDDTSDRVAKIRSGLFAPDWLRQEMSNFDPGLSPDLTKDDYPPVVTIPAGTDAMAPTIEKGDDVTVSLSHTHVDVTDGIWLFNYGGLKMLRRLMPLPAGGFRVSADNPRSPTFEASERDIGILGRAFWLGRRLT